MCGKSKKSQTKKMFGRLSPLRCSRTSLFQSMRAPGQLSPSVRGKGLAGEMWNAIPWLERISNCLMTHLVEWRPLVSAAGVGTKLASFLTWSFSPHLARYHLLHHLQSIVINDSNGQLLGTWLLHDDNMNHCSKSTFHKMWKLRPEVDVSQLERELNETIQFGQYPHSSFLILSIYIFLWASDLVQNIWRRRKTKFPFHFRFSLF